MGDSPHLLSLVGPRAPQILDRVIRAVCDQSSALASQSLDLVITVIQQGEWDPDPQCLDLIIRAVGGHVRARATGARLLKLIVGTIGLGNRGGGHGFPEGE